LVVGAHYDHLGMGEPDSRYRGTIHRGADDNASGVAALLAVARSLAARHVAGKLVLERDIIFAAWSGEEIRGQLGSKHFVGRPTARPFHAYVNMDMIGRLEEKTRPLEIRDFGNRSKWGDFLALALKRTSRPPVVNEIHEPASFTDSVHFQWACVPSLSLTTGTHFDWHKPSDVPEKLSYPDLERIALLVAALTEIIATDPEPLNWDATHINPDSAPPCAFASGQ
jgi:Zn-dependent M28 family amino/carboxypeptidase